MLAVHTVVYYTKMENKSDKLIVQILNFVQTAVSAEPHRS